LGRPANWRERRWVGVGVWWRMFWYSFILGRAINNEKYAREIYVNNRNEVWWEASFNIKFLPSKITLQKYNKHQLLFFYSIFLGINYKFD